MIKQCDVFLLAQVCRPGPDIRIKPLLKEEVKWRRTMQERWGFRVCKHFGGWYILDDDGRSSSEAITTWRRAFEQLQNQANRLDEMMSKIRQHVLEDANPRSPIQFSDIQPMCDEFTAFVMMASSAGIPMWKTLNVWRKSQMYTIVYKLCGNVNAEKTYDWMCSIADAYIKSVVQPCLLLPMVETPESLGTELQSQWEKYQLFASLMSTAVGGHLSRYFVTSRKLPSIESRWSDTFRAWARDAHRIDDPDTQLVEMNRRYLIRLDKLSTQTRVVQEAELVAIRKEAADAAAKKAADAAAKEATDAAAKKAEEEWLAMYPSLILRRVLVELV